MRLLLDTHALIWWVENSPRLSRTARTLIVDPGSDILVSAISAMEICTKYRIGKLPQAAILAEHFAREIAIEGFAELRLTVAHAQLAGTLAIPHNDPFDRMLIAQSLVDGIPLVSNEAIFDAFGVMRVW